MPAHPQLETVLAPARKLFAETTLVNFIEQRHKDLFTVDETATVGDALRLLAQHKVLSAPVVAGKETAVYTGCISLADILKGLVKQVEARRILHGTSWDEKVAAVKEADLVEIGKELFARPVSHFCHAGSLLLEAEEGVNLAEVLESGFNIHDSHPHHRIYVCHEHLKAHDHKTGPTHSAGAGWHATDVVSQTDLLAFLQQNAKTVFPELAAQSLESLGLTATGVLKTNGATTTALDAFHKMFLDRVPAIGLVDEQEKLVGNLSITDLRDLTSPEALVTLLLPATEYVKPHAKPLVTLPSSATLGNLLDTLVEHHLRRVYIIGEEGLDGIVSISDVLRLLAPEEDKPDEREEDEEDGDNMEDDE